MLSGVGEGGVTHDCLPGFFTQASLSVAGSVKASEYYDGDVLRPPFFPPTAKDVCKWPALFPRGYKFASHLLGRRTDSVVVFHAVSVTVVQCVPKSRGEIRR